MVELTVKKKRKTIAGQIDFGEQELRPKLAVRFLKMQQALLTFDKEEVEPGVH